MITLQQHSAFQEALALNDRQRVVLSCLYKFGAGSLDQVNVSASTGQDFVSIAAQEVMEVGDICFGEQPRTDDEPDHDHWLDDLDARHEAEMEALLDRQEQEYLARRAAAPRKAQPSLADLLQDRQEAYDAWKRDDRTIHYRGASIEVRSTEGYSLFEYRRSAYHFDCDDFYGFRGVENSYPLAAIFETIDADCGMPEAESALLEQAWMARGISA